MQYELLKTKHVILLLTRNGLKRRTELGWQARARPDWGQWLKLLCPEVIINNICDSQARDNKTFNKRN